MSYFHKKHRTSNSAFSNQVDESSVSNFGDESLSINSNIFNKNGPSQQKNKNGYAQNHANQGKESSPISYLKNFKKSYCKANQQNIQFIEPSKQTMSNLKNQISSKKEYQIMMNEVLRGKNNTQDNKSTVRPNNINQVNKKKKDSNVQKFPLNAHENSFAQHPFLNQNDEHSMEQILNSSINQFQRFLEQQREQDGTSSALQEQNINLKRTLSKFKSILKQKLQNGLNKQKEEMKNMLNEYVELITKLLHDKQDLSSHIQELEEEVSIRANQIQRLSAKVEEVNRQKDDHIQKTKHQIDEFLEIIQQFQNEAKQENQKFEEMQVQLQRLSKIEQQMKQVQNKSHVNSKKYSSTQFQEQQKRIDNQSQKIQTLLQLLEKSQQETNTLKEILTKQNFEITNLRTQLSNGGQTKCQNGKSTYGQSTQGRFSQEQVDEMKAYYQQKLEELEMEHEQEFIQYEKAIKQTITKKDQCIERLNYIIGQLRQGKKNVSRGRSINDVRQRSDVKNPSPKFSQERSAKKQRQSHLISQNTFNEEQIAHQEDYLRY